MTAEDRAVESSRSGAGSVVLLALLGGAAAFLLAHAAPDAAGPARLRSPKIALAVFDTVWLLLLALPRDGGLAAAATKLAVGLPFHAAIAATVGAGPGFHVAWALTVCAWAAVGAVGVRSAPRVHGFGVALLAFALPLAAYAAGEFGGFDTRTWFLASPLAGPVVLARGAASAVASDALPALVGAIAVVVADVVALFVSKAAKP